MAERWLSVAKAAEALGVSESTVRRRLAEDKLESRPGANGLEVRILLGDEDEEDRAAAGAPAAGPVFEATLAAEARAAEAATAADGAAAALAPRLGRYAPLPNASDVGTPVNPDEKPAPSPFRPKASARLTPGEVFKSEAPDGPEDELKRYQRLAGASVILAQQQADDARERVAFARAETHRLRRHLTFAWVAAGLAVVACVSMSMGFGLSAAQAEAEREAQAALAAEAREEAQQREAALMALQQEEAARQARAEALAEELAAARREAAERLEAIARAEAEKRQTEAALHTALTRWQQAEGKPAGE